MVWSPDGYGGTSGLWKSGKQSSDTHCHSLQEGVATGLMDCLCARLNQVICQLLLYLTSF